MHTVALKKTVSVSKYCWLTQVSSTLDDELGVGWEQKKTTYLCDMLEEIYTYMVFVSVLIKTDPQTTG